MEELPKNDKAIVARTLEAKSGEQVVILFGAPYRASGSGDNYKCDYIVDFGTRRIARTVEGMDSLHVFLLSLSSARRWIVEADIVDPLSLRWEGSDEWGDLGFALPD